MRLVHLIQMGSASQGARPFDCHATHSESQYNEDAASSYPKLPTQVRCSSYLKSNAMTWYTTQSNTIVEESR